MGSYAYLSLGSLDIAADREEIDPGTMLIFRESDKYAVIADQPNLKDVQARNNIDDEDIDEYGPITIVRFSCPAHVAKDRLDLMGFTREVAISGFKLGLSEKIAHYEGLVKRTTHREVNEHFRETLQVVRKLQAEDWLSAIRQIIVEGLERPPANIGLQWSEHTPLLRYMLMSDRFGFPGYEYRHYIRLLLEAASETDELEYDLTDLVVGGWLDNVEDLVSYADELLSTDFINTRRVIVLTEGRTDKWVIERSLNVLYPHLAEYFHFYDFNGAKKGGGAGELANTVKAFAAAGIANKIVALFDNDTAGDSAIRTLSGIAIPRNIVVLKYPDIELARNYPTLGPAGLVWMDINGLAGSIELYLGRDVLEEGGSCQTPIQWTGYDRGLSRYQGEILNKPDLLKNFDKKLKTCETEPSSVSSFDWDGMSSVLRTLRSAFHDLDASEILKAPI